MSTRRVEQLVQLVTDVRVASAPADVAVRSIAALEALREVEAEVCAARDAAICELHESGLSLQQIRDRTGLSRARLHQIIRATSC